MEQSLVSNEVAVGAKHLLLCHIYLPAPVNEDAFSDPSECLPSRCCATGGGALPDGDALAEEDDSFSSNDKVDS